MERARKRPPDTEVLEPPGKAPLRPQRIAVSRRGMVSTAHVKATEAGVEILERGGSAVDAAVAAAFALGVCEPLASGLGGQTMIMFYDSATRRTIALDGSSRAPHRVEPGMYSRSELLRGHRASTVPSTPAVLDYFRRRHGSLKLREVLAPSIRLAGDGYPVTELQSALTKRELKKIRISSSAAFLLRKGRRVYTPGAMFRQPVLAETLGRLAKKGVKDFYRGQIAQMIHDDMEKNGGLIRKDDLAQIPLPIERKPVAGKFGGWRILSFPPPGAGRTLIETLNIIDCYPEWLRDPDTPDGAVALAAAIRQANLDRRDRPFDPHFYPQIKEKRMVSPTYAQKTADRLLGEVGLNGETTHLSVMDGKGNVVALTQSIERVGGSLAAAPELGFLYNNYMSAFEYEDITHPYYLRPNAVPWASVAPTIVFRGRKPWLAIGTPGSERIASAVAQVLLRLMRRSPYEAVSAPRLHCALDGTVSLEATRMRSDVADALREAGFELDVRDPYSFYLGCVQIVIKEGDRLMGVADPRRDGSAGGPRL